jgi:hypothetical protein
VANRTGEARFCMLGLFHGPSSLQTWGWEMHGCLVLRSILLLLLLSACFPILQTHQLVSFLRVHLSQTRPPLQSSPPGLARKVVNCLKCGKVYDSRHPSADVMAFLGAKGTCTYCGHRVHLTFTDGSTNEDSESVDDQVRPKQEDRTRDDNAAASSQSQAQAQAQAEALRQRLVEYDRHSAKRTAVIDDQSDYFAIDSNAWLSDEERALLRRRHAEEEAAQEQRRKRLVVTVDLLGRRVLVERDERESEREDEEGGEQVDGGLIDRDGGAIAAAMAATAAERPQGGGTAAAVAALAPAARVTACPGVGETGRYVYVGGEKRGGLAGGKQSREQAEKFRKGGERVQHEDVFEVAAAELAALMGGVR